MRHSSLPILLALSASPAFVTCETDLTARCEVIQSFQSYNASKRYEVPGLRFNDGALVEDEGQSWQITSQVFLQYSPSQLEDRNAMHSVYISTGDSQTEGISICHEGTWAYDIDGFQFSREVMEKSVDDNGDCKTMFGEECVEALRSMYIDEGVKYMAAGSCDTSPMNHILPEACRGLTNEHDSWNGNLYRGSTYFSSDLLTKYNDLQLPNSSASNCTEDTVFNRTCPISPCIDQDSLRNTYSTGIGTGGPYNQSVRIPHPTFLTFFPNRSDSGHISRDNVHVQIMCLRPDEVRSGSFVPPSTKELLDQEGAEFDKNATNPNSATSSLREMGLVGSLGAYMSAAVLAIMFLI